MGGPKLGQALGPLDKAVIGPFEVLGQACLERLVGRAEAVKVQVVHGPLGACVGMHQAEGGAGHRALHTQGTAGGLHQSGFPCAQVSVYKPDAGR